MSFRCLLLAHNINRKENSLQSIQNSKFLNCQIWPACVMAIQIYYCYFCSILIQNKMMECRLWNHQWSQRTLKFLVLTLHPSLYVTTIIYPVTSSRVSWLLYSGTNIKMIAILVIKLDENMLRHELISISFWFIKCDQ